MDTGLGFLFLWVFCLSRCTAGVQEGTWKGDGWVLSDVRAPHCADLVGGLWLSEPGSSSWESRAEGEGRGGAALLIFTETLQPEPPPLVRQNGCGVGLGGQLWLQRHPNPLVGRRDSSSCLSLPSQGHHPITSLSFFFSGSGGSWKQGPTNSLVHPSICTPGHPASTG